MAGKLFIVLTHFTAEIFMHLIAGYLTQTMLAVLYNIHRLCHSFTVACKHYNPGSYLEILRVTRHQIFSYRAQHSASPKATFPFNWLDSCEVCSCLAIVPATQVLATWFNKIKTGKRKEPKLNQWVCLIIRKKNFFKNLKLLVKNETGITWSLHTNTLLRH